MAAPSKYPDWATDQTNNLEPPAGKVAAGWVAGEEPPSGWFNWWQNLVGLWVRELAGSKADVLAAQKLAALNLTTRAPAGGATDNYYAAGFGLTGGAPYTRTWLAVGQKAQYSTNDGRTWLAAATDLSAAGVWYGVAFGAGVFALVGNTGPTASDSPLVRSSTDGSTWTARTLGGTPAAGDRLNAIVFAGGRFVAVGDKGHIQTSTDGITWTKRTAAAATDNLKAVAYCNGRYVAVGNNNAGRGVAEYSTDGTTWSRQEFVATVAGGLALAASSTEFVAAVVHAGANADSHLYSSPDGVTWTYQTGFTGFVVSGATCLGGLYAFCTYASTDPAFGQLSALIAGAPGSAWKKVPVESSNALYALANNGDKLLVAGHFGFIADSLHMVT